ncbi:MAG: ArsR/SmtB family transcription factor [Aquabacterium sp.]
MAATRPSTDDLAMQARCFAALGDPTRLSVFRLVARQPMSVAEVAQQLPVSRPAVSQHLRVLADAGLVSHEVQGTRHLYRPEAAAVAGLRAALDSLWDVALARFAAEAERAARVAAPSSRRAGPSTVTQRPGPAPARTRRKETR